jgi:hypothetical protein
MTVSTDTLFPCDYGFWESMDELVQQKPPEGGNPELLGLLASVGIVHDKPFKPDERMRKPLEDAAVVGNATARTVTIAARPEEGFAFYPKPQWCSALFVGGYEFLDPPPLITADRGVPYPGDGARRLDSHTNFFYMATGATPAMCMRLTGIGSQYIYAMRDSDGTYLDGGRDYRLTLPAGIPESRFWSVMLYDRQTRSMMLQAGQPKLKSRVSQAPLRPIPTVGPTSTSAQSRPRARRTAGSRPCSATAGGRSCGSTTHSRPSSTRPGVRARSKP